MFGMERVQGVSALAYFIYAVSITWCHLLRTIAIFDCYSSVACRHVISFRIFSPWLLFQWLRSVAILNEYDTSLIRLIELSIFPAPLVSPWICYPKYSQWTVYQLYWITHSLDSYTNPFQNTVGWRCAGEMRTPLWISNQKLYWIVYSLLWLVPHPPPRY